MLAALVVLPGLGGCDVWNPDEARYAQVAREMAAEGRLWVPEPKRGYVLLTNRSLSRFSLQKQLEE